MKILEYIASQDVCLCEGNRLRAFIARVENQPVFVAKADGDMWDEFDEYNYPPLPEMQVIEVAGLAIIPVVGMITKGLSVFEQRYYGCADVDRIRQMVTAAANNPVIKRVLFVFASGGGYITGVEELAEEIAALTAKKKTYGYTDSVSCSASYELMAQCGEIYAAPSALVGSIGTFCTFTDYSKMADQIGIKVYIFASGKYKGMGTPGTSLTDEQQAFLQGRIDKEGEKFRAAVRAVRPQVTDETMQGQWLSGQEALDSGLVDGLVPTLEALLNSYV